MPFNPSELRDNRGRWTASQILYPDLPSEESNTPGKRYVSPLSPKEILGKMDKDGFVSSGGDKGSHQCVPLVKEAVPQLGPTSGWRKGADITGPDDPNLQPGTAIGYGFNPDSTFPHNKTGQHAGIAGGRGPDGKQTITDQFDHRDKNHPDASFQRAENHSLNFEKHWSVITREK